MLKNSSSAVWVLVSFIFFGTMIAYNSSASFVIFLSSLAPVVVIWVTISILFDTRHEEVELEEGKEFGYRDMMIHQRRVTGKNQKPVTVADLYPKKEEAA